MPRKKKKRKKINFFRPFYLLPKLVISFFVRNFYFLLLLIAIFLIGWGLRYYALNSGDFIVKKIEVENAKQVSVSKIINMVAIKRGTNIFELNLRKISFRIENNIFRIKKAYLYRVLPDTIKIKVEEREDAAALKLPFSSKYFIIDNGGFIIRRLGTLPAGLVLINANYATRANLHPGKIFLDQNIKNSLELIGNIKSGKYPVSDLETVTIDYSNDISIRMKNGPEIKLGQYPEKALSKLAKMPELLENTDIKYIDLRYKDIVVKE